MSGEFFVAAHNCDGFMDICHLGSEFALRRLDLPADWRVNSVQVLEDRLLLLTRYDSLILAIFSLCVIQHVSRVMYICFLLQMAINKVIISQSRA